MNRAVFFTFLLGTFVARQLAAAPVKDLKLEYRPNGTGGYSAVLHNQHAAAVTAYLAQVTFQEGMRERHSALGGDTLGFTNGSSAEIPARGEQATGHTLPRGAAPGASRILAAIYADGVTEGEEEDVQMLLSGRQRAYADLKLCIPALDRATSGQGTPESLAALFQSMEAKDQSDAAELDDIEDAPGRMRHRFFLSAVPTLGSQMVSSGESPAHVAAQFRQWQKRLAESKPDVR